MKKNNGFALAEVVIASGIFAICITIVLSYVSLGLTFCGKSRDMTRAMNIARLEMAKVENIPFPPTTDDSTFPSNFTVAKADSSDDGDFQIEVTPTDKGTDVQGNVVLKQIEVNVYRKSDDTKMVTLYTYVARNGLY